jgi:hypothetical protein
MKTNRAASLRVGRDVLIPGLEQRIRCARPKRIASDENDRERNEQSARPGSRPPNLTKLTSSPPRRSSCSSARHSRSTSRESPLGRNSTPAGEASCSSRTAAVAPLTTSCRCRFDGARKSSRALPWRRIPEARLRGLQPPGGNSGSPGGDWLTQPRCLP